MKAMKYATFISPYDSPKKISTFLKKCRDAVDKLMGFQVETDEDFWSTQQNEMTYWEVLSQTHQLVINDGCFAIDFQFGGTIYADYSAYYYKKGLVK